MLVHFWCKLAIYAEFCGTKGRQPIQILMGQKCYCFNLILFLTMKHCNLGPILPYLYVIHILSAQKLKVTDLLRKFIKVSEGKLFHHE